jgi:hypothetical protein
VLARCPSCRNTFSTDHPGRQICPVCQKPLIVPEPAPLQQPEAPSAPNGTPWERRTELGLWRAWLLTMQEAVLEPAKLFASARLDRGSAQLGFAVLTGSAGSVLGQLFGRLMSGSQRAVLERLMDNVPGNSPVRPALQAAIESSHQTAGRFLFLLLLTPIFSVVMVYLNAAVTHAVAVMLRQSKRGFPATFAACAYACAPFVLSAVPACGAFIGILWFIVLTAIGMKVTHGISSAGAAASVIVPYCACCCVFGAASVFLAVVASRAMGGP